MAFDFEGQDAGLNPRGHSQGVSGPVGYWQASPAGSPTSSSTAASRNASKRRKAATLAVSLRSGDVASSAAPSSMPSSARRTASDLAQPLDQQTGRSHLLVLADKDGLHAVSQRHRSPASEGRLPMPRAPRASR